MVIIQVFLSEFRSEKQLSLPHDSVLVRILELRVLNSPIFEIKGAKHSLPVANQDPLAVFFNWKDVYVRGCQIGMQGPQLCSKPRHFCKLDVATSRMAFLDLNLHVLQVATSNSKN